MRTAAGATAASRPPLTDEQIERYSRQIILPGVGGVGQQSLLASHLLLAGESRDIETAVHYLAGAGVGRISFRAPNHPEDLLALIAATKARNPDVSLEIASPQSRDFDLKLVLVGSSDVLELLDESTGSTKYGSAVVARLDSPCKIAILPSPPPCPRCAAAELLAPFNQRSRDGDLVAILAAVEALKLLLAYEPAPTALILDFDGLVCTPRALPSNGLSGDCRCGEPGAQ
jgi:hypothetical protein